MKRKAAGWRLVRDCSDMAITQCCEASRDTRADVGRSCSFISSRRMCRKFLGDGSYNSVAEIDPFFAHPFYEQLAVAEEMVRVHDCFVLLELGGQADDAVLPGMA